MRPVATKAFLVSMAVLVKAAAQLLQIMPGRRENTGRMIGSDHGLVSSLRYLFADFLDEQDETPPLLPGGLPQDARTVAGDGIRLLMDYQGASYARLYVERLQRFIGKPGIDTAILSDIARLMAGRMAYEDVVRIAQL